jgi:hypothetical protein
MRILRGLGSDILPCGCFVGLYETYDGKNVAMIDAVSPRCTDRRHRLDAPIAEVEVAQHSERILANRRREH